MSEFDPERFKQQERAGYNLIAPRYEAASQVMRAGLAERLLDAAQLAAGQQLLDIACGPGATTRAAAQRVLPGGSATGCDIAEAAIELARQRAAEAGVININFDPADAERLPYAAARFDRVLCGLGLMHFPAADRALAEMARVTRSGGQVALSVWGEAAAVPLLACAIACLKRNLPPPKVERPSVFRFGQPDVLRALLQSQGFAAVSITPFTVCAEFASAEDYWHGFLDLAGVSTVAIVRLPEATQALLARDVANDLAPFRTGTSYRLDSIAWIATAVR